MEFLTFVLIEHKPRHQCASCHVTEGIRQDPKLLKVASRGPSYKTVTYHDAIFHSSLISRSTLDSFL